MSHDRSASAREKNTIPPSAFVQVKGVHAYTGESEQGLSLDEKKRNQFFSTTTSTLALLTSHPSNPILEEGKFETAEKRERKGEYFITPVALTFLIAKDIKKYQERKADDIYNTKNIFIINRNTNPKKLSELLSNLKLTSGEDAKIVYIYDVHAVTFYLRNEAGKMKCYIADSQGDTYVAREIARAVQSSIKEVDITIGPNLQRDHYSCFTFTKKAMMYFIKHGKEVFEHIDKVETKQSSDSIRLLALENLMPTLLKLGHINPSSLPTSALDAVISVKAKTTLREYLSEKKKDFSGKSFNTAAVQTKYKYFSQLNETLTGSKIDEQILKIATSIYSRPETMREKLTQLKIDETAIIKKNSDLQAKKRNKILIVGGLVALAAGVGFFALRRRAADTASLARVSSAMKTRLLP